MTRDDTTHALPPGPDIDGPARHGAPMVGALPALVLAVCLLASSWLALDRGTAIDRVEHQARDTARAEFGAEVAAIDRQIANEIDRVEELRLGLSAAILASGQPASISMATYLALTDAGSRFGSLRSGAPISVDGGAGPFGTTLHRALVDAVGGHAPTAFLSRHRVDGEDYSIVAFPISDPSGASAWAALVFDTASFLTDAISPGANDVALVMSSEPVAVRDPVPGEVDPAQVVATLDTDRLVAEARLDIFGTAYDLRVASAPGALPTLSRMQQWLILAVGALASVALALGLRVLIRSRAAAQREADLADRFRRATDLRFRASFERAPIGMAELDGSGSVVEANGALCGMLDCTREAIVGRPLNAIVHDTDRPKHAARLQELCDGHSEATQSEHRYVAAGGRDLWVHESISVIDTDAEGRRSMLVQCQDITSQRRTAWELMQKALHDELTGLPNRALFLNRLKNALDRSRRKQSHIGVLFIDIDRFKLVNDSLGHEMGDAFLVEIAGRLQAAIRQGDTVARFGGDEFVVLCEEVTGPSETVAVAQRVHSSLALPIRLGDTETFASASIGIALSTSSDHSAEGLLRDADAAMYRAKERGRNRSEMFDTSMRTALMAQLEIESQLRSALANGEIVMHYQAIVDPNTHLATGYEALVRWNHPSKGLLGPGAFLPVAEEAGLIHLIDTFALATSCRQIAEWSARYPLFRNLYITTNWSARNLHRFVQEVEQILSETRINPRQLVIEVTEGFLLEDTESSLAALQRLKSLGVQIAIDDFGTGYSSLSYLTRLSVDFLKIDRSFVTELPDPASAAVVGAIADMATRLGIGLVAEGVETDEQLECLRALGAPRLQGYRFAKPRPAADIDHQLSLRSGRMDDHLAANSAPQPVGAGIRSGELEA